MSAEEILNQARQERLSDLYRLNPEPTGFRIRHDGLLWEKVYPTYEAADRAATQQRLLGWKAEPQYGSASRQP